MIPANGLDDKFIQPEGLPNYVVAPPSPLDPSSDAPVMGNDAAIESEENDSQEAQILRERKRTLKWLISRKKESKTYFTSLLVTYCNSSKDIQ